MHWEHGIWRHEAPQRRLTSYRDDKVARGNSIAVMMDGPVGPDATPRANLACTVARSGPSFLAWAARAAWLDVVRGPRGPRSAGL